MVFDKDYRVVVSAIVLNKEKKVLMCEHIWIDNAWQFPQGEIEEGETPEETVKRELWEELGMKKVVVIDKLNEPIKYHFPYYLKKKYGMSGNSQYFLLLYYYGDCSEIKFNNHPRPEFKSIKWVDYDVPPREVIYFKKLSYLEALNKFRKTYEEFNPVEFEKGLSLNN